jgi:hypothetical protein
MKKQDYTRLTPDKGSQGALRQHKAIAMGASIDNSDEMEIMTGQKRMKKMGGMTEIWTPNKKSK